MRVGPQWRTPYRKRKGKQGLFFPWHVKTQWEGSHLHLRRRALPRTWPCWHPALSLQPHRLWENRLLLLKPPTESRVFCYGSPARCRVSLAVVIGSIEPGEDRRRNSTWSVWILFELTTQTVWSHNDPTELTRAVQSNQRKRFPEVCAISYLL